MIKKEKLIPVIFAISFLYLIFIIVLLNPELTAKIIAQGGKVTQLNFNTPEYNYWYGLYGNFIETEEQNYIDITNNEHIINFNPKLLRCNNSTLYITTSNNINWNNLIPAHPNDINNFLNIIPTNSQSGNNIFNEMNYFKVINNNYLLYSTKTNTVDDFFIQGLLKQNNNLVFVMNINLNKRSFNNELIDYQIMLPKPINENIRYYFFLDPNDIIRCNITKEIIPPEYLIPYIEPIPNIETYVGVPFTLNIKALYPYIKTNESFNLYFKTIPTLSWFKIETTYNPTQDTFFGIINFTPINTIKGTHNITIIATDHNNNTITQNISLRIGYCGDKDATGNPICDVRYENCENCPEDCGICGFEKEYGIGIISSYRNCLNSNFTINVYELYTRATCENKGMIIDEMEICKKIENAKITIYILENQKWIEYDNYITDKNGKLTFIPKTKGIFKIEAEYKTHKKGIKYINFQECIYYNESIIKKFDNETKEQKTDEPITIIDYEKETKDISKITNLKIIHIILIIIVIILTNIYYHKEKDNSKLLLKIRIQLITYKKIIKPKIKRIWNKTKDIIGF
jgi:hypothetical protein